VRTVTRTLPAIGAMLIGIGAAAAQAPSPRPAVLITPVLPEPPAGPGRSQLSVIDRLVLSFDANADHRISRDELPERMQGLIARGDRNADAALDLDEIRALVNAASSERIRTSVRPQASEGLPGVVSDLKLPPGKHDRALAIVSAYKRPPNPNEPSSSDLYREMRALLDDEEYENFVAAAARLSRSRQFNVDVIGGVVGGLPQPSAPRKH
jgi:hypothetical protein